MADRARDTYEKGNKMGSTYMACIAGMWTNYLKQPHRDPFKNDDYHLQSWWECGWGAYDQAVGITLQLRKEWAEAEKERARKAAKEEKSKPKTKVYVPPPDTTSAKKPSFWKMKLW